MVPDSEVNVLAMQKDEEWYVFLFSDQEESRIATLRMFGRMAADPELSFSWYEVRLWPNARNRSGTSKTKTQLSPARLEYREHQWKLEWARVNLECELYKRNRRTQWTLRIMWVVFALASIAIGYLFGG